MNGRKEKEEGKRHFLRRRQSYVHSAAVAFSNAQRGNRGMRGELHVA